MTRTLAVLISVVSSQSHTPEKHFTFNNVVDVGSISQDELMLPELRFRALAARGEREITLRIDSFGGSIFGGARFIRTLEDVKKSKGVTVHCVVDGAAMSMAAVLLESPLCDTRHATSRSVILFHNGHSQAEGTAEELREAARFLGSLNQAMSLVVAARICMDVDAYRERIAGRDWVMAVTEALSVNVIDGIVSPNEIASPE